MFWNSSCIIDNLLIKEISKFIYVRFYCLYLVKEWKPEEQFNYMQKFLCLPVHNPSRIGGYGIFKFHKIVTVRHIYIILLCKNYVL